MKRFVPNRRTRLILGASALAVGLTAWMTVAGVDSPEAREIKDRLRRQAERVQSLEVTYNREAKTPLKPEQLRALSEFRNQLFLPRDEWHEVFKGDKRYQRRIQAERVTRIMPLDDYGLAPPPPVDPKASAFARQNQQAMKEQYDRAVALLKAKEARGIRVRRKDPAVLDLRERDETRAFNGKSLWMRRPRSEKADQYEILPASSRADWFQVTPYQTAVGLHVPDPTGRAMVRRGQSMFQVPEWIDTQAYELEPKTEVVDGSTCVVLKGSLNSLFQPALFVGNLTDRIWFDRDHGLALRKRELFRDGQLQSRWENTQLREVEPGFWLPTLIRTDMFALDAPPEWKGKPVVTEEIRVETLAINQVPDDRFDMVPKKGDSIVDLRGTLPGN
jgi:hypothetical protein